MNDFSVDNFKEDIRFRKKIVHIKTIPHRVAKYSKVDDLNPTIKKYLNNKKIKLYKHQAIAYEKIKNKKNVIITTSTASGKTLAFNLPILDDLSSNDKKTALYIYPAKALSNDQLNILYALEKDLNLDIKPQRYDGDTPKSSRYSIRQSSRIILTNPYQLHHILSWHHQWRRFYSNLNYIMIDEAHYYKGIFGSNVAYLIRRLKRIAKFYGSSPQFILSSATLANPLELANKLTGEEFELVDKDSSPSGEKDFILYNPFIKNTSSPPINKTDSNLMKNTNSSLLNKKSFPENKNSSIAYNNPSNSVSIHQETELIFIYLILKDIQTLCFTVSRKIAELIAKWGKQDMLNYRRRLVNSIITYRAGYLADERREIENGLKTRKYIGVTCTNALELGINIGSIDAVIISGYPGTMISVWQQAGRAGRENQKSLVILIAFENQIDQYFMNNPEFFFDKPCENAIIDLSNQILNKSHLLCAANELQVKEEELSEFNLNRNDINPLINEGALIRNTDGIYSYGYNDDPSFKHSLNQLSSESFKVMNNGKLLETMETSQSYREAHVGAVLINKGETYIVNEVNLKSNVINVSKHNVEYHTVVLKNVKIKIVEKIKKIKLGNFTIHFGQLEVLEDFFKYKKVHFSKTLGVFPIDMPLLKFKTKGLWFTVNENLKKELEKKYDDKNVFIGSLHGLEHSLTGLYPLHVMCDRFDIDGLSDSYHEDTQKPSIFIYDAYEGGIGINEKAVEVFEELIKSSYNLLENCNCDEGCPACIYPPKSSNNNNKLLHKEGTIFLLDHIKKEIESKSDTLN